ncbi:MAG TPA: SpoIIE family protein phosphatase, partial [Leptospiraceae bacterium]|nr:SpoIIE family protein phosphatase [Leptospiraceae bacterium]
MFFRREILLLLCFTSAPAFARMPVALENLRWSAREGFVESYRQGLPSGTGTRSVDGFPISMFTLFPCPTDGFTHHFTISAPFELEPDDFSFQEPAGIFLRGLGDNWELYVNGTLVHSEMNLNGGGQIAIRKTSMGKLIPFEKAILHKGTNTIVLHLAGTASIASAVNPAVPGLFFSKDYTMDRLSSLQHRYSERIDLALLAVYLFFGLYHLVLFLGRRKDKYNLYFALFTISLAVYGFSRSYAIYDSIEDSSLVTRVENASVALLIPLLIVFLSDYFYQKWIHPRLNWIICGFNFLAAALFCVVPFDFIAHVGWIWKTAAIPVILIYAPFIVVESVIKKARDAKILATALAIFVLVAIFDLVRDALKLFSMEPLFQYAFFGLVLSIAGILAHRFVTVFNESDRLNQELAEKNETLRELDRVKDEFIGTISHELRTPLNGIVGLAEALTSGRANDADIETGRTLGLIVDSGRRLSRLVGDLIELVRLKNRDLKVNPLPIRIADSVDVVLSLIAPLVESRPITISSEIKPETPAVFADPDRLQQILFNLIWNAAKFTDKGRVTIRARPSIKQPGFVTIEVEDTGIGIPAEKQRVIFEAFRQADSSIARPYSGAGLGLSITRYLVELHGGSISVTSTPGKGSIFCFTLPASTGLPLAAGSTATIEPIRYTTIRAPQTKKDRAKSSILAVDDEPINLEVLRTQLSLEGYDVTTAENGERALQMIEEDPPDLVVLDIMMPRISGYQVCEEIRKHYSIHELPVLLLTARNQLTDLLRGFDSGANDYLTKPFEARELSARVRTLLAVRHASQEKESHTALAKELAIARDIQRAVLPRTAPHVRGLTLATRFRPRDSVGGDFFDFYAGEKTLDLIMADVSGHGVPAALIAAMIKIAFSHQRGVTDPAALLFGLNRALWGNLDRHFVTAIALSIDLERRLLCLASAGHPPLLIHRAPNTSFYSARGRVIGLVEEAYYSKLEVQLEPGDMLVVYTDGLTEARAPSGDLYGEDRLSAFIETHSHLSSDDLAEALEQDVVQFAGETL